MVLFLCNFVFATQDITKYLLSPRSIYQILHLRQIVLGPLPVNRAVADERRPVQHTHTHKNGLDHFGIRVKDLDSAVRELRDQGVEIMAEPVSGSSGISYAFVTAPDGVIIELTQYGLLPKMFLKFKKVI